MAWKGLAVQEGQVQSLVLGAAQRGRVAAGAAGCRLQVMSALQGKVVQERKLQWAVAAFAVTLTV